MKWSVDFVKSFYVLPIFAYNFIPGQALMCWLISLFFFCGFIVLRFIVLIPLFSMVGVYLSKGF